MILHIPPNINDIPPLLCTAVRSQLLASFWSKDTVKT